MLRTSVALWVIAGFPAMVAATALPSVSSGTLALQLDADTNVSTGTGNTVQSWSDANGNGIVFSDAGVTPAVLVPNALNNQAVVRFSGGQFVNNYLMATAGNLSTLNGQPLTVFLVTQNASSLDGALDSQPGQGTAFRTAFGIVQVADGNGQATITGATAGSVETIRYSLGVNPATPANPPVRHFETFLDSVATGPTAVDSSYGNAAATTLGDVWSSNATVNTSPYATVIGAVNLGGVGAPRFNGDIAEIVIYQGALSDADRLAVQNALATAYAAPEPAAATLLVLPVMGLMLRRRGRYTRG